MQRPFNPTSPCFSLEKSLFATADWGGVFVPTVSRCPFCPSVLSPPARFITAHDSWCHTPDATPDFCLHLSLSGFLSAASLTSFGSVGPFVLGAFCCVDSVCRCWSGNVLVKRFNNVSSVCTPNTVVCWEVWGYRSWVGEGTGGQSLCYLLISSLQRSILLIVQIKNCCKKQFANDV